MTPPTPPTPLDAPLVLAPMAGGPSTVELVAAVSGAGGFGFLAGGYLAPERLAAEIAALRARTGRPFGVNLFVPTPEQPGQAAAARDYARALEPWAVSAGVALGDPRWSDDHIDAKISVVLEARPAVVSFTFGWPPATVVDRLHAAGIRVWCTVNEPAEVEWAQALGADAVVAQGWQAGGHRGGPRDPGTRQPDTLDLVRALAARTDLPVVAAGGIATGTDGAALLAAGAAAVAVGTAYLLADEAGTSPVHRDALQQRSGTVVTRAFTGRSARALRTSWTDLVGDSAPAAYPQVHVVTAPLRAHGRATGEAELVHLWAGTGHRSARAAPAAEITADLLSGLRQPGT